jgi:hypothetical protein
LKRLLPGEYNVVRLLIKGDQIVKALENGVSKYPALEGRFPMVNILLNIIDFWNNILFKSQKYPRK